MWEEPYVLAQRDWWSGTWRIWLANRAIDAALIIAIFWATEGLSAIETETFWMMMAVILGAGFYVAVRNWLSAILATGSGDDGIGTHSRGILSALRKVNPDVRDLRPHNVDGLRGLMNSSRSLDEHRLFAAMLYGTIKAVALRLPQYRKIAYENAADLAILQYVKERGDDPEAKFPEP